MRDRFVTGIIAGSLLGATAGMYALYKTSPRQRRKVMRQGSKMFKNAARLVGTVSQFTMFR